MKILVVGGAGYLGGAVTDLLQKTNHSVRVYDSLLYEESYRKEVDFVYGDIRDRRKLSAELKWADVVVWLAALVGDGACAINPEVSYDINAKSVEWYARKFDKRVLFTSTCSVYGAQDKVLSESSPVKPLSVYASSKLMAESHLANKNTLIFRLGTLFGLSDVFSRIRMDLVVNTLTAKAFYDSKLKVFGGEQYRPVVHVRDAARVIVENINTKATGVYNINYKNVKIVDLASRYIMHFPDLKIETVDMKFEDSRNYRVSGKKAEQDLKFKARISIDTGIKELKKLFEEQRIKDIDNPRYTNQLYLSFITSHNLIWKGEGDEKKQ